MNCEAFSQIVSDLVRSQVLEARTRDGALDHIAICQGCRARLEDEHHLSRDLRTLAEAMKPLAAPAQVESRLMGAFHNQLEHQRYLSLDMRVLAQAINGWEAGSQ